ncbi:hypothetical protein HDU96_002110, partial [Phlyctochytrium bullatum]
CNNCRRKRIRCDGTNTTCMRRLLSQNIRRRSLVPKPLPFPTPPSASGHSPLESLSKLPPPTLANIQPTSPNAIGTDPSCMFDHPSYFLNAGTYGTGADDASSASSAPVVTTPVSTKETKPFNDSAREIPIERPDTSLSANAITLPTIMPADQHNDQIEAESVTLLASQIMAAIDSVPFVTGSAISKRPSAAVIAISKPPPAGTCTTHEKPPEKTGVLTAKDLTMKRTRKPPIPDTVRAMLRNATAAVRSVTAAAANYREDKSPWQIDYNCEVLQQLRIPSPTFRDPLNPLLTLLDQIHISFALETETSSKRKLQSGLGPKEDEDSLWVEKMVVEKFFRKRSFFGFEMVHPRTYLETYKYQPRLLRYALCAFAGRTSIPPAPVPIVRMFFNQALTELCECFEVSTPETVQAMFYIASAASGLYQIDIAWRVLGMSIRMAEYLKLHIDPSLSDDGRASAPWVVQETLRRVWWALYFADRIMVTLHDSPGFISEQALSTMSVLPACDHNLFMSLGPMPSKTPEPVPLSPRHRMNQVVAIVADISRIVPIFELHRSNLAELSERRSEMVAKEGALKQVLAELPEGVGEEPSKEF